MRATAVIGANFGDEGKGLMTDYFAEKYGPRSLVVRYNGGAQAGHTVERDGKRHVFQHFGAGTLASADTYLSEFFYVNPVIFTEELNKIVALDGQSEYGLPIEPYVSDTAPVTTVVDMLLGQFAEMTRGRAAHGSVGLGVNETRMRHFKSHDRFMLDVALLTSSSFNVEHFLSILRKEYVPIRAAELNITGSLYEEMQAALTNEAMLYRFASDCDTFIANARFASPRMLRLDTEHIIFEGAQGLGLDMKFGNMPHVTPSRTGLANLRFLCQQFRVTDLEIVYVTRPYLTRHGAGPLSREVARESLFNVKPDKTNVSHQWQGEFRYAVLNSRAMHGRIKLDYQENKDWLEDIGFRLRYAVTHLDELGYQCQQNILQELNSSGIKVGYISHGPTAADVGEFK